MRKNKTKNKAFMGFVSFVEITLSNSCERIDETTNMMYNDNVRQSKMGCEK